MKYIVIVVFALVLNSVALNAAFFTNDEQSPTGLSVELNVEKADVSEGSDSYDEPFFCVNNSFYPPLLKSTPPTTIRSSYLYKKVSTLLKPPDSIILS